MTALNFPAESNAVRFEINATPVSIPKSIGKSAAIFTQKKSLSSPGVSLWLLMKNFYINAGIEKRFQLKLYGYANFNRVLKNRNHENIHQTMAHSICLSFDSDSDGAGSKPRPIRQRFVPPGKTLRSPPSSPDRGTLPSETIFQNQRRNSQPSGCGISARLASTTPFPIVFFNGSCWTSMKTNTIF